METTTYTTYQFLEVNTPELATAFLELPMKIYADDPNFIRPLDQDINKIFNPKKNKFFSHGDCTRWMMKNDKGEYTGRVAVFINNRTLRKNNDQPTGGMGFFECINDQQAANALFDKCKEWLEERNVEAMDGPINFGERNNWWGLLVEGFSEPTYAMNYHPPYYTELFENYGFQVYFKQFSYGLPMMMDRPEKYYAKSEEIFSNPDYHFEHVKKNTLEKYAIDFMNVYNKGWGKHAGFKQIKKAQAMKIMEAMRPILREDLIWFGYYKDEAVAIFVMLPEVNKYFKYVNGKMNWWAKIKVKYHMMRGTCRKVFGAIFGVIPEHQRKGMEAAIIMAANKVVQPQDRWDDIELTWIGDFNP